MADTKCDALSKRFAEMKADGLVDVKFYARNVQEAPSEQLCAEVERIYDAYDRKEYEVLDFQDSYHPA